MVMLSGLLLALSYGCTNTSTKGTTSKLSAAQKSEIAEGFTLYENYCISCHSPNASMENRLAPPMIAVKRHYLKEGMPYEEFAQSLFAFLNNPSEDISKMPGALRKFNLMPKMNFPPEQISKIAAYLYYTDIEKPDWFDAHFKEQQQKNAPLSEAQSTEFGQKIALQTKSILGKNLLQAIQSKGTENALSFCHERAIPLTDSMALASHARIKRVSDKNRNPSNQANRDELLYIATAKKAMAQGKSPEAQVTSKNNKNVGYYPILTNAMCLQCHGTPQTDITPATMAKIKRLYPKDLATGYKTDELRGIWVVEWDQEQ